jgi:VWFA-related protein
MQLEVLAMRASSRLGAAVVFCFPFLLCAQQTAPPDATTPQAAPAAQAPAVQTPALTPRPAAEPAPAPGEGSIKLDVVVSSKDEKPVAGLSQSDFTLMDNGQPARILSFHASGPGAPRPEPPPEVILLLDTVNLGFQSVTLARQDVEKFLRQNGGHLAQPVSIFLFTNEGVKVQLQPSTDGNKLAEGLGEVDGVLRTLGRSAGVNGAIERFQLSLKWITLIANSEAKRPGRKLLIWMGSGWPLLERTVGSTTGNQDQDFFKAIVQLSTLLRQGRMSLYSVSEGTPGVGTFLYENYVKGVKSAHDANVPNLALKVVAMQSGGRVFAPSHYLENEIDSCVEDAATFYTITFDPPKADVPNEYHDLKVTVDKPGLMARTRTGYYNQP